MSYQFKYMDVPSQKTYSEKQFSPLKFILQSILVVAALGIICHFKMGSTNPSNVQIPTQDQIASAAQAYNAGAPSAHVYQGLGINPSQETLAQAQDMAHNFMSTGDLSQFEKLAGQNLSLDF